MFATLSLVGAQLNAYADSTDAKAEWALTGGTVYERHYSELDQINRQNASRLGFGWAFTDFVVRGRTHRGVEATPVVVGGVMYFSGPWSVVYALDAKDGHHLWTYDPQAEGIASRKACCDVVNRGIAVSGTRVFIGTTDGYVDAVDAKSGKRLWRADAIIDRTRSYTSSGAPRVADDQVIIGNSGADMGTRGYVSAYDMRSGKLTWRFFIVPGDPSKGPDEGPEVTLARKTWSVNSRWDLGGGGNAWDGMAYDPATHLVFIGTGNGGPYPRWMRSPGGGDNLFLSSIVALDARTGKLRWYYQTTPGDSWDYTATSNIILADIPVGGRIRKVLMQAPKNGFFYVLDRETGQLLSAEKYTQVTWAHHIDLKTGRPVKTADGDYADESKWVTPAGLGGHNWKPMAYSPQTGLLYIPVMNGSMQIGQAPSEKWRPGSPAIGSYITLPTFASPVPNAEALGRTTESGLVAWDPAKQRVVWRGKTGSWWNAGGVLATAGGLVISGDIDGNLSVNDAKDGRVLKTIETGTAMGPAPMTYEADGVQYIAVLGGYGGAFAGNFLPGSAPEKYENQERLLVFKLDGTAVPKPPLVRDAALQVIPVVPKAPDSKALARGQTLYLENCARCHQYGHKAGNFPDLWNMSPASHAAFQGIVSGGALQYAGMASFSDVLSTDDVDAIHGFLSWEQAKGKVEPTGRTSIPHM
jgi:quinohemoprotein ethanol dehydrogenase